MAENFKYAGSVSHGTMRDQDLIPRFLEVLADLDKDRAQEIARSYFLADNEDMELWCDAHPEQASNLTSRLFEKLDALAPEGYYFGASEGDGADYGFWEYPDNEGMCTHERSD